MSTNGLRSDSLHPYQKELEKISTEPIAWIRVSEDWIRRYGGAVEKKKLQNLKK